MAKSEAFRPASGESELDSTEIMNEESELDSAEITIGGSSIAEIVKKNREKEREFESSDSEYIGDSVMSVSQEEVEAHPERYILPECLPACQALWSKNIYTFMTSNHDDVNTRWIQIDPDNFSAENLALFEKLSAKSPKNFQMGDVYRPWSFTIGTKGTGEAAGKDLLKLADKLKMQDVPEGIAYLSTEDFLILYDDCYDEVLNPEYREMEDPVILEDKLNTVEFLKYFEEYSQWLSSPESQKTIKKFNAERQSAPLEDLVTAQNMILDDKRVYFNDFHYQKHLNFVKSQEGEK